MGASNASVSTARRMAGMDLLKCFAIFLVVAGHCIQYLHSTHYSDEPGYRLIYSFHMPLFMMVTGYFFVKTLRDPFGQTMLKKARQLLLPVLTWGVIFTVGKQILVGLPTPHAIAMELYWGMWFLKSAFCCCLLGYLAFGCKPANLLMGGVITIAVSQFIHFGNLQMPFMYPCFYAGGLVALKDPVLARLMPLRYWAMAIFIALLVFLNADVYDAARDAVTSPLWQAPVRVMLMRGYLLAMGIAGALFFIIAFNHIPATAMSNRAVRLLADVGGYTLGIYVVQTFVLEWFMAKHLNFDAMNPWVFNLLLVPTISLVLMALIYVVLRQVRKMPLASFLLLGTPLKKRK